MAKTAFLAPRRAVPFAKGQHDTPGVRLPNIWGYRHKYLLERPNDNIGGGQGQIEQRPGVVGTTRFP